jgi:hypothetical protein
MHEKKAQGERVPLMRDGRLCLIPDLARSTPLAGRATRMKGCGTKLAEDMLIPPRPPCELGGRDAQ